MERRGGRGIDLIDHELIKQNPKFRQKGKPDTEWKTSNGEGKKREKNLVTSESNVRSVNEAIAFDGVVGGEIGGVAVVNGGLEGSQVEAVPQIEQKIWRCHGRFRCFLPSNLLLQFADLGEDAPTQTQREEW